MNLFRGQKDDEYVNDVIAAVFLGVNVQSLRNWRHKGTGPRYYKIGGAVRYLTSDLKEYFDNCIVNPIG